MPKFGLQRMNGTISSTFRSAFYSLIIELCIKSLKSCRYFQVRYVTIVRSQHGNTVEHHRVGEAVLMSCLELGWIVPGGLSVHIWNGFRYGQPRRGLMVDTTDYRFKFSKGCNRPGSKCPVRCNASKMIPRRNIRFVYTNRRSASFVCDIS